MTPLEHSRTSIVELASGRRLLVRIDDYTDPWLEPPALLLLHGTAETGMALHQWVPWLSRHFRVIRPDLRGMGGSSPIAAHETFGLDDLADDLLQLMDLLQVRRCYLAGAKLGGLVSLILAARHPEAVQAVSVACALVSPRSALGAWIPEWRRLIQAGGVRAWVDATQPGRMADELGPDALNWWSGLMAQAISAESLLAYFAMEAHLELTSEDLAAIQAPVQLLLPSRRRDVLSDAQGSLRYDQRRTGDELKGWRQIPRLVETMIDSNSFHVAATHPDPCARATRDFFLKQGFEDAAARVNEPATMEVRKP